MARFGITARQLANPDIGIFFRCIAGGGMNAEIFLEPIPNDWAWLDDLTREIDEDFVEAVSENAPEQDRPEVDFFK
jgi:hypothetical protein